MVSGVLQLGNLSLQWDEGARTASMDTTARNTLLELFGINNDSRAPDVEGHQENMSGMIDERVWLLQVYGLCSTE